MGFRGRIWLSGAVFGVILVAAAFALFGSVDVAVAVQTAGRVIIGLGLVLAVAALLAVLGIGRLDHEIVSRPWWGLSLLADGASLVVLGLGAQRSLPGDALERMSFSMWTLVALLTFCLLGFVEAWADRRAAPTVRAPLYRPRRQETSDDPYRFVGSER